MANLMSYESGEYIRKATCRERRASELAARSDGGAGVIDIDGRSCYVDDTGDDDLIDPALGGDQD